jgi:hypothetical protein
VKLIDSTLDKFDSFKYLGLKGVKSALSEFIWAFPEVKYIHKESPLPSSRSNPQNGFFDFGFSNGY